MNEAFNLDFIKFGFKCAFCLHFKFNNVVLNKFVKSFDYHL